MHRQSNNHSKPLEGVGCGRAVADMAYLGLRTAGYVALYATPFAFIPAIVRPVKKWRDDSLKRDLANFSNGNAATRRRMIAEQGLQSFAQEAFDVYRQTR
ncbi:hypothetical protein [Nostoc sp. CHAB 5715]|uniref:hypothetical protein n=1 Tax=Nostoc sp. CHAB 5715 TaxID=2780400 RepID=UPI001E652371|nr:hypothetical protein [Nostoc sp. CHAB 5715]MCC5624405.1 hypothetical protein [Nostoc sp. CHAB 5715]